MIINRTWAMPNKWTFQIPEVAYLIRKYKTDHGWIDPFSGESSLADITNDIDEKHNTIYHMDALEFLKIMESDSASGCLFDPPYSTEQCLRKYTPKQKGTAGRAEYWAKCKDQIRRIIRENGIVISFSWDSCGMGKKRDFTIKEILLVCHGACHNDTIVTVEQKVYYQTILGELFEIGGMK